MCPIIIFFRVLANTKEYKKTFKKNLKNKNHKKYLKKKPKK
jgi:hypothetical protein